MQQNRYSHSLLLIASITAAVGLAGCTTLEPMQVQGDPVKRVEGENFTMRLEFVDEAYLRARYGDRENTFIVPRGISNERLMVFELDVEAQSPFRFDVTAAELQFGPAIAAAQTRFRFTQLWDRLDTDERRSAIERQRRDSEINSSLFANTTTFVSGQSETGLLVFYGRFPRYGSATVILPVTEDGGRPIERAEFQFEF